MSTPEGTETGETPALVEKYAEKAKGPLRAVMSGKEYKARAWKAWGPEETDVTSAESEEAIVQAAREISRGLVFSILVVVGAGLMTVVLITHVDWFYPAAFFGFVTYVAWQRYF